MTLSVISADCEVISLAQEGGVIERNNDRITTLTPVRSLAHGDKDSLFCRRIMSVPNPVIGADVVFTVAFRPPYTWFTKTRHFRFATAKQSDGRLRWEHVAE